ncbi:MAG: glycosyltransferase family 2 protein [Planctomycetaceae bacterium]|nr:glycosyltransferase family 2 protein [Planctomycetota bacterium]NUN53708.1 glycosyltransferase family 2 protein [Planctomycetaceae bacterium]
MNGGAPSSPPRVTVAIPVYDEEATVARVVARVLEGGIADEVLVVDDGSLDGTAAAVEGVRDPRVRLLRHPRNRGKGAALRTAIAAATGEVLVVQDADLEYDPADYPALLDPILEGRADAVFGSRFLGGPHRVLLFWHYAGNRFLTLLSNMITNLNLTDMETGAKAFRMETLRKVTLRQDRFGFEPEVTAKMARAGARIWEVSVSYAGRTYAEGKKITWVDALEVPWVLLRARFWDPL